MDQLAGLAAGKAGIIAQETSAIAPVKSAFWEAPVGTRATRALIQPGARAAFRRHDRILRKTPSPSLVTGLRRPAPPAMNARQARNFRRRWRGLTSVVCTPDWLWLRFGIVFGGAGTTGHPFPARDNPTYRSPRIFNGNPVDRAGASTLLSILARNLLHAVDNHDVAETFPRIELQAELILDGAHEGRAMRSVIG
jgi:hypothetical protein